MRAYFIRITEPGTDKVLALYSAFNPNGSINGAALQVEFDIPAYAYGDPAGNAYLKISGINYADIQQANDLNDADIVIYGGMAKGLPLANPAQAGVLLKGSVFQCFGNWQGTQTSLELMVIWKEGTDSKPVNLTFVWRKGMTLQAAVTQALRIAYPGAVVTGAWSSNLIYTEDQPFSYKTPTQLARWALDTSRAINPDPKYIGAQISPTPNGFNLYDGTVPPGIEPPKAKEISFLDLIGQPTWIDSGTMQFKTVLRADLSVGDLITMPQGTNVVNTVNSFTRFRNKTAFQGQFQIRNIRHLGNSRQPSADSWCTVIDTYASSQ